MPEGQSLPEVEPNVPLADAVSAIFERRATHGGRELILEQYQEKFQRLIDTLPKENRDTLMVDVQKFFVKINGWFSEYGARVSDFIRNVVTSPMIRADKDFPKDVYYQLELSRAQAWGDFAMRTTKTATAARTAYRNNFLPAALTGSIVGGVGYGLYKGIEVGTLAGGLGGAVVGAALGAAIGGGVSVGMRIKDRIMGPPVIIYPLGGGVAGGIAGAGGSIASALTGRGGGGYY